MPTVGGGIDVSWAGGPSLPEVQVLIDVLGGRGGAVSKVCGASLFFLVCAGACYGIWNSRGPGLSHHTTCGGWERVLRPSCIAQIPWLEPMGSVWSLTGNSRDIKGSDRHMGFFGGKHFGLRDQAPLVQEMADQGALLGYHK